MIAVLAALILAPSSPAGRGGDFTLGVMPPSGIVSITDKMTASWNAMLGTTGSGYGLGDTTFGFSAKQSGLQTIVGGLNDAVLEAELAGSVKSWPNSAAAQVFQQEYASFWGALNVACQSPSLSSACISEDSLAYYYNVTASPGFQWQCLAAPDWVAAYTALTGAAPNPLNCYFEVLQGASWQGTTFTNALGKLVVVSSSPTTTLGYTIPPATFAGGFAQANVTAVTGSGVLTVTGLDQQGASETWTYTVTTTGRVLLVPTTHSYSLVTKVSTISVASGITACTIYIEANRPSGRTNPPT